MIACCTLAVPRIMLPGALSIALRVDDSREFDWGSERERLVTTVLPLPSLDEALIEVIY